MSVELSELEYIMLGVIDRCPKTLSGIAVALSVGVSRWKADSEKTSSILNHLNQVGLVVGYKHFVQRKAWENLYYLTQEGKQQMIEWLDKIDAMDPDLMLIKFFFMKYHFDTTHISQWLERYENEITVNSVYPSIPVSNLPIAFVKHEKWVTQELQRQTELRLEWIRNVRRELQIQLKK